MYLDRTSIVRSFKDVFGIDHEEIAVRFAMLFNEPHDMPKMHKADIVRYYEIIKRICQNVSINLYYLFIILSI